MRTTLAERFWSKVEKTPSCWLWRGATNSDGYGSISVKGRMVGAHRVAYELVVGPIPAGLTIDHLCKVVNCVQPWHLEPVTIRVNILRGANPAAQHARQRLCVNGHELAGGNLRLFELRRGYRSCMICARAATVASNRKYRLAHLEEYRRYYRERARTYRERKREAALRDNRVSSATQMQVANAMISSEDLP